MSVLTENNLRAAFIALSRAIDPRNAPDMGRLSPKEYADAVEQHKGQAIEAAVSIAEEVVVLFQRFVVAQEKQADMLMFLAKAVEKQAGIK